MPLEDNEWDMVRCLVTDYLVATADPYSALQQWFPNDVSNWTISQRACDNADMLIGKAKEALLSDDRPLSIHLLVELTRIREIQFVKHEQHAMLKQYIERLRNEKAALDSFDPYQARILPGSGEIFINRDPMRDRLRGLVMPEPRKPEPLAMRVVGGERAGKTYTYSFILHLSSFRRFSPIRVTLDRSSTAEDILRELSVKVAREGESPTPVDDRVKRLRHWAQWLVERARYSAPQNAWWFVFDQCDKLDPGSEAAELIAQLAIALREMTVHQGAQRPRLILLGHADQLADLPLPRKQVVIDRVNPVCAAELTKFFDHVLRSIEQDRRPGAQVDESWLREIVAVAVQQVLDDAAEAVANGENFMDALCAATEETVDVYSN